MSEKDTPGGKLTPQQKYTLLLVAMWLTFFCVLIVADIIW